MIGKGYDRLIIVDSIKSEKGRPEQFYKLKLEELPGLNWQTNGL